MKRKNLKKLKLNMETVTRLDLKEVVGGETERRCYFSVEYTNCPLCGDTNYISCLGC